MNFLNVKRFVNEFLKYIYIYINIWSNMENYFENRKKCPDTEKYVVLQNCSSIVYPLYRISV